MVDKTQRIFWDSSSEENIEYKGGLYFRSDLKDFIKRVESNNNAKVVAIAVETDSYNIELITKEVQSE
tara:strand:- start:1446 stop:1649 length:204 start_codon:yes stop_codon:yes gene_type:complete